MLDRLPPVSVALYRRITAFALVALVFIIVTGAGVRLTGSGLGCPTWPTCETDSLTPHGASSIHAYIEFGNRMVTGLVSIGVALAVLGAYRRVEYRRDLVLWAWGLVVGVVAQILWGGVTVLTHLAPEVVIGHFVISMALVWNAVVLHRRASEPAGTPQPIVAPEVRTMSRVSVAAAVLVVITGTVLTGSGPHGGDEDVERLGFLVPDVARIHGIAENLFLAAVLITMWLLRRTKAPASAMRDAQILLAVLVAQAVVGYVQYFSGVPELLVAVHIFGAASVWTATCNFHLRLWRRFGPEGPVELAGASAGTAPAPVEAVGS